MITVKSFMEQLTNSVAIHREVQNTLRELDPSFLEEETKFNNAVSLLKECCNPSESTKINAFLISMEQVFSSTVVYVGWLGFQFNLDCYLNPTNKLRLREDFEELHMEYQMDALSIVQDARRAAESFLRTLPEDKKHITNNIIDYYTYLQTTAYKLVHYFGFLIANNFLYYTVPGYATDLVLTNQYARKIQSFMDINLSAIVGKDIHVQ